VDIRTVGAMKGLLQIGTFEQMPLVYDLLKRHGEATRRLQDNYVGLKLILKIAIEQNVSTQIKNLETYPAIRPTTVGN